MGTKEGLNEIRKYSEYVDYKVKIKNTTVEVHLEDCQVNFSRCNVEKI